MMLVALGVINLSLFAINLIMYKSLAGWTPRWVRWFGAFVTVFCLLLALFCFGAAIWRMESRP